MDLSNQKFAIGELLSNLCQVVNNNKFVSGCTMLLLNLGSKYVIADLGLAHEKILTNEYTKKIIILSMFFVATRDIIVSFLLTIAYIVVIDGLLHENRRFSLLTAGFKKRLNGADKGKTPPTDMEYVEAEKVISRYHDVLIEKKRVEAFRREQYQNYLNTINHL